MKDIINEDNKSIKFICFGAIDFHEQINIELSDIKQDGFIEIHPLDLMRKINELNYIECVIFKYFIKIVDRVPRISDINESIPKEDRYTQIFYKCYKRFNHFHEPFGTYHYTKLSIEDAIMHIKTQNMAVVLP